MILYYKAIYVMTLNSRALNQISVVPFNTYKEFDRWNVAQVDVISDASGTKHTNHFGHKYYYDQRRVKSKMYYEKEENAVLSRLCQYQLPLFIQRKGELLVLA